MSFALTKCTLYSLEIPDAVKKRAVQRCALWITGTAADVALDFGTYAGTFWTAALADATYGPVATQALAQLKNVSSIVRALVDSQSDLQMKYIPVATLTANGQYTQSLSNNLPVIALNAANGLTAYTFVLEWDLLDEQRPIKIDIG